MGIMLIASRDKNPIIKCERKQLKNRKPQKSQVQKFHLKCMKIVKKFKRKVNSDLQALDDKNLEKIQEENNKLC